MSIPELISGISLGSAYVRPGDVGPITSITYIAGGWITVDTTSSLNDIDQSRTSTGQIAYISESKELYIAKKVAADWITTFEDSVTWSEFSFPGGAGFPFSGSAVITGSLLVSQSLVDFTDAVGISGSEFSGSFVGDGSGLTGIASSLYLSGSSGASTISLKDNALLITGSAGGIIVTVTNTTASFTISNEAVISGSFSGSFEGDGSGLTGIASSLYLSGSTGQATINLKDDVLLLTGSSASVEVEITNNTASFTISDTAVISGSFSGSFEGSLSAAGTAGQVQFNSASLLAGATDFYYDWDNKRVGIGVESPTTKLDVHGDALITGSLTVEGIITAQEFHTEFVSASIVYESGSTKFGDTSDDIHSFSGSLRVTGSGDHYFTDGNVGIGTASPASTLEVKAPSTNLGTEVKITNNFGESTKTLSFDYENTSNGVNTTVGRIEVYGRPTTVGGPSMQFKIHDGTTLNEVIRISGSGNIGIGTTSPQEKLTVAGSVSASGDLYLDGALYDNNKDSGTLGQILQSTATGIDWVDPTGISVQAEQVFATVKNTSGTTLYKGTPVHAVSGSSSGNVNPVIAASASVASTMPATFILNEDLADEAEGLAISLGRITDVDTSAFNVGDIVYVGVNGGYTNIKPSGSANLIQNLGVVTKKHASNGAGYVYGSGRSNDVPNLPVGKIWVGSTTYSVTSSLVHLDEPNSRMGVGITSPSYTLDVSGSIRAINSAGTGGVYSQNFYITNNSGTVTNRMDNDDSRFYISYGGGSNRALNILNSNGNIGIGTTSPVGKLEVAYETFATYSPSALLPTQAIVANRNTSTSGSQGASLQLYATGHKGSTTGAVALNVIQELGNSSTGTFTLQTRNAGTYAERMRVQYDGNVGINTTSPANTLDVAGNVYINSNYPSNAAANDLTIGKTTTGDHGITIVTANTNTGAIFFSDNDNNDAGSIRYQHGPNAMRFTTNRGERMRITSDGNVGIGTTAPESPLHVVDGTTVLGSQPGIIAKFENPTDGKTLIRVQNTNTSVGAAASAAGISIQAFSSASNQPESSTHEAQILLRAKNNSQDGDLQVIAPRSITFNVNNEDTVMTGSTYQPVGDQALYISSSGAIQFPQYGSGDFTGTATYTLRIDASGNVIEDPIGAGAVDGVAEAQQVTFWQDTDTISGSNDLTWDGTVLTINGTLEATEKSFVIDHPTQENKKLVYGVLEGPEHAVYCRGKISGEVIELPEEWTGLVDQDTITVQLTSIGKHQNLYVADIRDNKIFIKNGDLLSSKINAFYYVQGTRKDVKPLVTVRDK